MFGSTILEVAVGLVFLYLVLSVLCTSANEGIARLLGLRAENFYQAVHGLFTGPDQHLFAEKIFNHPSVTSLSRKGFRKVKGPDGSQIEEVPAKPTDIPASTFSHVVTDLLGIKEPGVNETDASGEIGKALESPAFDEGVVRVFRPLISAANGSLDGARKNIETWYDHHMEQAQSWYKRKTQVMTCIVGFLLVFAINADTIMAVDTLWTSPTQRAVLENAAKSTTNATDVSEAAKNSALSLIGWSSKPILTGKATQDGSSHVAGQTTSQDRNYDRHTLPQNLQQVLAKLLGLIITVFAVSLGAPFWFDRLKTIMNIGTGTKTDDSASKRIPSSDSPQAPKVNQ